MPARISALIVLVLGIAAAWIIFQPVVLPSPRTLQVPDESWQLPHRSAPDVEALASAIEQNKLWGASGGPPAIDNEKPLTAPNWRIIGIVSAGREHVALVSVEEQPIQELKAGDKLPGGAKILDISPDRICILLNGKKRALRTYKE